MFDVERLRRQRDELIGELTVTCEIAGARTIGDDKILSLADWNLSSADSRWRRAKHLAERSQAEDIDWGSLLEELAQRVIAAERRGSPAKPLTLYESKGAEHEFDVDGWRILKDHPTIAFGDGGSAKSYLALYLAGRLVQQGQQVLYVDWELSGSEHRDRLERMFSAPVPTVHYMACDKPIVSESDRIFREARRLSIDYMIFDSIAFATAGPPEAAEHATAYFRVVRQIGVGSLHLAHVNKSENGDQKPFGSTFWHNAARSTWFMKAAELQNDGAPLSVGLYNRKNNCGRLYKGIAFDLQFGDTFTRITRSNLADNPELAVKLPIWQRMMNELRRGPKNIAFLAEDLDTKPETIQKNVKRRPDMFVVQPGIDGSRVALVERRIG